MDPIMKPLIRLLFCALFLVIPGCGGGSAPATGNPNPPPPSAIVTVSASPEAFVIPPSGQASLLAAVEGSSNQVVAWSSTAGQVTQTGMFTAPATKGLLTLQAASMENSASTAQIQVLVDDDEIAYGLAHQVTVASASFGIWPSSITLQVGQSAMLLGYGGNPADLRWAMDEGTSAGTITSQGSVSGLALAKYQAPAAGGVFHVSFTSQVDPTIHARARIIVRNQGEISVVVVPSKASLMGNESKTFTAQVTGTSNHAVIWSALETEGGSITPAGAYTAPGAAGIYHVVATSAADPAKSAQSTVTVTAAPPGVAVSVNPAVASLQTGQTQAFSATVTGSANAAVIWGVIEAGGGSITSAGLYTSPGTAGTYHVFATSVADATKSAMATVTVIAASPGLVRIAFLHHSTGYNVWQQGVPQVFQDYNQARGTNYQITEMNYPSTNGGYPWANYPYDYYNLWVLHTGSSQDRGELNLDQIAAQYDVIVFKHCFPVSEIQPDTGSPDISSSDQRLENYKAQYTALKQRLLQFPAKKFIVWIGAVDQRGAGFDETSGEPQRAKAFFDWVKQVWNTPGDNIFVWDFAQLETEGTLYNRYPENSGDNHPNTLICSMVAPYFAFRAIDVIEGRGDAGDITGRNAGVDPPSIGSFSSTPATGGSSTLNWTTSGATRLCLDQLIGPITGTSRAVNPTATTTFNLTATNLTGSTNKAVTVTR